MKWFLLAAVLAVLLSYGLACLVFHGIFYRPKRSKKVPKAYVDTPHYKASRAGMALMDKLPVENVTRISPDGLKLHAYLYPVEGERKKFLLGIHGYKSYARPEFGPYIAFYQSLGYSLLLPDDRAHAPSEGTYIGVGVLDRLDCVDWANWLVEQYGADIEIRLHGVSMGGATVLAASGEEDLPPQVKGIVADCGYTSAWEIFRYHLCESAHLPAWPLLPLCDRICRHRAGFGLRDHAPLEQVKRARVPILFVHGGKDAMVPARMCRELYEACGGPKEILEIPGAGHAESIALEPEKYHAAIRSFFHI